MDSKTIVLQKRGVTTPAFTFPLEVNWVSAFDEYHRKASGDVRFVAHQLDDELEMRCFELNVNFEGTSNNGFWLENDVDGMVAVLVDEFCIVMIDLEGEPTVRRPRAVKRLVEKLIEHHYVQSPEHEDIDPQKILQEIASTLKPTFRSRSFDILGHLGLGAFITGCGAGLYYVIGQDSPLGSILKAAVFAAVVMGLGFSRTLQLRAARRQRLLELVGLVKEKPQETTFGPQRLLARGVVVLSVLMLVMLVWAGVLSENARSAWAWRGLLVTATLGVGYGWHWLSLRIQLTSFGLNYRRWGMNNRIAYEELISLSSNYTGLCITTTHKKYQVPGIRNEEELILAVHETLGNLRGESSPSREEKTQRGWLEFCQKEMGRRPLSSAERLRIIISGLSTPGLKTSWVPPSSDGARPYRWGAIVEWDGVEFEPLPGDDVGLLPVSVVHGPELSIEQARTIAAKIPAISRMERSQAWFEEFVKVPCLAVPEEWTGGLEAYVTETLVRFPLLPMGWPKSRWLPVATSGEDPQLAEIIPATHWPIGMRLFWQEGEDGEKPSETETSKE